MSAIKKLYKTKNFDSSYLYRRLQNGVAGQCICYYSFNILEKQKSILEFLYFIKKSITSLIYIHTFFGIFKSIN